MICKYIYCGASFNNDLQECPVCGFPVDEGLLYDLDLLKNKMPTDKISKVIDMHQIIAATERIMDVQMTMINELNIEFVLLQSVPANVRSIRGDDQLTSLQDQHPGTFIASNFADPRLPNVEKYLQDIKAKGIKVIKLLPCLGYYPDDPAFDSFWKTMEELELIAMIHTGFITARHKNEEKQAGIYLNSKYCQPIFLDVIARKFPELVIILCHMGGAMWNQQAAQMVSQHENVYGDISGFGNKALKNLLSNRVVPDWKKVFWGNDSSPYLYPINLKLFFNTLKTFDQLDLAFSLLYDNADSFIKRYLL